MNKLQEKKSNLNVSYLHTQADLNSAIKFAGNCLTTVDMTLTDLLLLQFFIVCNFVLLNTSITSTKLSLLLRLQIASNFVLRACLEIVIYQCWIWEKKTTFLIQEVCSLIISFKKSKRLQLWLKIWYKVHLFSFKSLFNYKFRASNNELYLRRGGGLWLNGFLCSGSRVIDRLFGNGMLTFYDVYMLFTGTMTFTIVSTEWFTFFIWKLLILH